MLKEIINLFIEAKNTLHMCEVIESDNYHSLRKKEDNKGLLSRLLNI